MSSPASFPQPLFHPATPGLDLRGCVWCRDGDSEAYSLDEVRRVVSDDRLAADRYHVIGCDALSYRTVAGDLRL